jgi:hypothetical protein
VAEYCSLVGRLQARIVNVAVIKPRITNPSYPVLDTALRYSIQRIENDLDPVQNPMNKFMIITDEGRLGAMRSTSRKMQRMNVIPSKFGPQPYRREIRSMIEDPLPKDSRESYFIQTTDLIAFVVYLYCVGKTGCGRYHGRMPTAVNHSTVTDWLDRMKGSLNLQAAPADSYGVKLHPE